MPRDAPSEPHVWHAPKKSQPTAVLSASFLRSSDSFVTGGTPDTDRDA